MHSAVNRVQGVFGFFTTVAFCVASLAALSVLLYPATDVSSSVDLTKVQVVKGRPHYYSPNEKNMLESNSILTLLFVYVVASFPAASPASETPRNSEAIIWDTIIEAPESPYSIAKLKERFFPSSSSKPTKGSKKSSNDNKKTKKKQQQQKKQQSKNSQPGVLHLKNQKSKYQITDISGKIAERENVTLAVGWNVQPWVGALWWSDGTGAWPRTEGKAGRSKSFNFPALKVKTEQTASN